MIDDYKPNDRPPEGWTEPDSRGHIYFVMHGPHALDHKAPKREGWEAYFVAIHGSRYTRWAYREVK